MRKRATWLLPAALMVLLGGSIACSVEKTQEGKLPDVDVDVDSGRWPKYDVNWADVDVGTTERTIEVPEIEFKREKKTVSVPYIDINPPGTGDREERSIAMEIEVPTGGYELEIREIRAAGDSLWVIGELQKSDGMATQATTRVSDQVVINAPEDLNVRKVIVGERPQGVYNQQYMFVTDRSELSRRMPEGGRTLYQRPA